MTTRARIGSLSLLGVLGCCAPPADAPATGGPAEASTGYAAEVEQWREERNEGLAREDSWLTLVGLYWLEPGENTFGSDPDGDIVFEEGGAPARGGSLILEGETVRLVPESGAGLKIGGEPAEEKLLATDADGEPDPLELGELRFHAIRRGDKFGLRVKHPNSRVRLEFEGLDFYPVDEGYRIQGDFVAYDPPKELAVATVLGTTVPMEVPGYAELTLGGKAVRLEPVVSGERYWYLFRDATSGKETYGAGRYLYGDPAEDGRIVVDFNYAYNPPCVFTAYATCPLPPRQNWLDVPVEAGEKDYGKQH